MHPISVLIKSSGDPEMNLVGSLGSLVGELEVSCDHGLHLVVEHLKAGKLTRLEEALVSGFVAGQSVGLEAVVRDVELGVELRNISLVDAPEILEVDVDVLGTDVHGPAVESDASRAVRAGGGVSHVLGANEAPGPGVGLNLAPVVIKLDDLGAVVSHGRKPVGVNVGDLELDLVAILCLLAAVHGVALQQKAVLDLGGHPDQSLAVGVVGPQGTGVVSGVVVDKVVSLDTNGIRSTRLAGGGDPELRETRVVLGGRISDKSSGGSGDHHLE